MTFFARKEDHKLWARARVARACLVCLVVALRDRDRDGPVPTDDLDLLTAREAMLDLEDEHRGWRPEGLATLPERLRSLPETPSLDRIDEARASAVERCAYELGKLCAELEKLLGKAEPSSDPF